jgi:nucleoside 2-deoxyribosyltransferase
MAFGRNDTDNIYIKKIIPVLRELRLNPIRVDRRQHKDDLNNFIIRMIKASEIVIADLTYARPSVYYEAGFAERNTPVIYTARKDHLSRSQPDDRLRVHFDLEMKKIVEWSSPNDSTFQSRLRTRLKYFLKPIQASNTIKERDELEEHNFASLSVTQRCEIIESQFRPLIKKRKFWIRSLGDVDRSSQWDINPAKCLVGVKKVDRKAVSVTVVTAERITQKTIRSGIYSATGAKLLGWEKGDEISKYEEHIFFCSLNRIPVSRLTAIFPDAIPDQNLNCFHIEGKATSDRPYKTTIWLLGQITTKRKAAEMAKMCIYRIEKRKTNSYTTIGKTNYDRENRIYFHRLKRKENYY